MKKRTIFFFLGLLCLLGRVEILAGQEVANHPKVPSERMEGAPVVVYGEIRPRMPFEHFTIKYWETPLDLVSNSPQLHFQKIKAKSGSLKKGNPYSYYFEVHIPAESYGYLTIGNEHVTFLDHLPVLAGDSLKIQVNELFGRTIFSGPQGDYAQLHASLQIAKDRELFDRETVVHTRDYTNMFPQEGEYQEFLKAQDKGFGRKVKLWLIDTEEYFLNQKEENHKLLKGLPQYVTEAIEASSVDPFRKQILRDDYLSREWWSHYQLWQSLLRYAENQDTLLSDMREFEEEILRQQDTISPIFISSFQLDYFFEKARFHAHLYDHSVAEAISLLYKGDIKDKLLAKYLFRNYTGATITDAETTKIIESIQDPLLKSQVNDYIMKFEPGSLLAEFNFENRSGSQVEIAHYEGKLVLINSWFTGCSASSSFYQNILKQVEDKYAHHPKVALLSISIDPSKEAWDNGVKSGKYSSEDWDELYSGTDRDKHPFFLHYGIQDFPRQMIIGPDGRIIKARGIGWDPIQIIKVIDQALPN
ncbi:thioredoxin family protein [Litoribacter ruber]|uniref:thioredoxin family protein n=1 Tax=Litoribacter ruber TaxID=702568 RepID=UPI001BD9627A|nr:thioredoxin family protein [Litoribacter ruber]MBT0812838.1 thioredoxin family protein [Litoribacter ruber]